MCDSGQSQDQGREKKASKGGDALTPAEEDEAKTLAAVIGDRSDIAVAVLRGARITRPMLERLRTWGTAPPGQRGSTQSVQRDPEGGSVYVGGFR